MEELRPDSVAAYVVAWHNRHPLARRIAVTKVQSVGHVAVPFVAPAGPGAPTPTDAAGAATAVAVPETAPQAPEPPAGATLRERALARSRQPVAPAPLPAADAAAPLSARATWAAAFSEDFIPGRKVRQVAAWVLRHGQAAAPTAGGPLRRVEADPALVGGGAQVRLLYAQTALVETGGQRRRLLIGAGPRPAVLGARLWSVQRLAAAAAVLVLAGVALAWTMLGMPGAPVLQQAAPTAAAPASAPASAAGPMSAASPAAAAASFPAPGLPAASVSAPDPAVPAKAASVRAPALPATVASAAMPQPAAAVASAAAREPAAASAAARAASVLDVEPRLGRVVLPPIGMPSARRGSLEEARAAAWSQVTRQGGQAASAPPVAAPARPVASAPRADVPPVAAAVRPPPAPAVAPPLPAATTARPDRAAAPSHGTTFAVSTRLLRTRAESEQVQAAMRALLTAAGERNVQVEIVAAGDDWRVVGWPFQRHADAEKARDLLAARGMRVQVIDF